MDARLPVQALRVTLVAAQAYFVLIGRREGFRGETDHAAHALAAARLDVRGSVAGMADQAFAVAGWAAFIGLGTVFRSPIALGLRRVAPRAYFRAWCAGRCRLGGEVLDAREQQQGA